MNTSTRPTEVTAIGWAWIGIACLLAIGAAMGLSSIRVMSEKFNATTPAEQIPPGVEVVLEVLPHLHWLGIFQIALASIAIITAVNFLRMRGWARPALENITWATVAYIVAVTTLWIWLWLGISERVPVGDGGVNIEGLRVVVVTMALIVISLVTIPLLVIIRYLRTATVRAAFGSQ